MPLLGPYRQPAKLATGRQNVMVIVFDALSAYDMSLHGYARDTTPNISRLADRAIVYHQHHASSDFTTPGTASLLTGVLPWAHRALELGGKVSPQFDDKSIFRTFSGYYRVVYSHNPWVYRICDAFTTDLDEYVPLNRLMLTGHALYDEILRPDADIAAIAWERAMELGEENLAYSLLLSHVRQELLQGQLANIAPSFPAGLPQILGGQYFLLERAVDWVISRSMEWPRPFMSYVHLLPPHEPFRPPVEFYGRFEGDGLTPPAKPVHLLTSLIGDVYTATQLSARRQLYDEYILYVDREFGRLFQQLESSGVLDDTWVVLTSDHGKMFERGFIGHRGPLMYQPSIRVPLLIFQPGRKTRLDVHTVTSAVDVLPTLLSVTGQDAVDWSEGSILPPFGQADPDRPVFALYVVSTKPFQRIREATAVMLQGDYKLMYMFGYPRPKSGELVELYDMRSDPEELLDLSASKVNLAADMLRKVQAMIRKADRRYV